MKDNFDKVANSIGDAAKDVRDTVREGTHRAKADTEHEKRAEFGDSMTAGEKVNSLGNEAKQDIQAGVDHTKRDIRDSDK